jgi:hypothetical protein
MKILVHASVISSKKNGGNENMNLRKIGVVMLALLLAAMAMVPMVSAEVNSVSNQLDNTTALDEQMNAVESKVMGPEYSVRDQPLSRLEFEKSNAEYIKFLQKNFNQSVVNQMVDNEYKKSQKGMNAISTAQTLSVPPVIQIGGRDIYLWPYTNSAPNGNSFTGTTNLIFYGMTNSQVANYFKNNGYFKYHDALGWTEYGYHGQSLSAMQWTSSPSNSPYQLEDGSYFGNRYHLVLTSGHYSLSLGKNWCYGQTHYEYWSTINPGHWLYPNSFDVAKNHLVTSNPSLPKTLTNLYNYWSGLHNGYGYIFTMS